MSQTPPTGLSTCENKELPYESTLEEIFWKDYENKGVKQGGTTLNDKGHDMLYIWRSSRVRV